MTLEDQLHQLLQVHMLAVPKDRYSYARVIELFGGVASETGEAWLIRCQHAPNPPAIMEQLSNTERALGFHLPESLHQFYQLADGGRFFTVPALWLEPAFPDAEYSRYRIYSTAELPIINGNLLNQFQSNFGDDPDFQDIRSLNYIAFCDAHNGHHLVLLLEGQERGKVFLLDYEALARPYSERDADFYYAVADSLEDWLGRVIRTQGWDGFGEMMRAI